MVILENGDEKFVDSFIVSKDAPQRLKDELRQINVDYKYSFGKYLYEFEEDKDNPFDYSKIIPELLKKEDDDEEEEE